ncbi:hypothetical protein [Psychromonas sp. Urea-02u-13]|uniref:hypothetical protein n=1 Tax=Psychromonas sp. Urea-02u-13 TaxID=2058326 RepID=UPI000C31D516|nr:hypothetical protein [Psychromonas sp. Urea-02u-13]PKG37078.1 hypothetical protein CXF74_20795 [Psychromonas sp. Urea-02u-13]
MSFLLMDSFSPPYQEWNERNPTQEEMLEEITLGNPPPRSVKLSLKSELSNYRAAAVYMINEVSNNRLEFHIDRYLRNSQHFQINLSAMPTEDPEFISAYKHLYPSCDFDLVSNDIATYGRLLPNGQYLYHGGYIPNNVGDTFKTCRPLSTSLCPQVAIRNADWRGKAFDRGEIHLAVIKITNPKTKAYIFSLDGELGNEKELLIASGLKLRVVNKTLIRHDFPTSKANGVEPLKKIVPAYLIELDAE